MKHWNCVHSHYIKNLKKEKIKFSTDGKFIEKIIYSPEIIKICFKIRQNPADFGGLKSPSPPLAGWGYGQSNKKEKLTLEQNKKFVLSNLAPERKHHQTFSIILPNLIHKSKKKNLKR